MHKHEIKKLSSLIYSRVAFVIVIIAVVCAMGARIASAEWNEPQLPPPQQAFPVPLTIGGENQAKSGYLQLDPEYNPNEETSLSFDPQRPLDVRGTGLQVSTPAMYIDQLLVDTDTLYVSSADDWVGVGTATPTAGYQLVVDEGTLRAGDLAAPVSGRAVRATSADSTGIYADSGATGLAGVYGLYAGTGGWAVRGESASQVGVRGESETGTGIYATNQSSVNAAVYARNTNNGWAAYFQGRLGVNGDIIAERFLQTYIPASRSNFAVPAVLSNARISDGSAGSGYIPRMTFDGTYLWVMNQSDDQAGNNLYQIRTADGEVVGGYHVSGIDPTIRDIAFDGRFLWFVSSGSGDTSVMKFDPEAGRVIARCSTVPEDRPVGSGWGEIPSRVSISTERGQVYIWTANVGGGDLTKFDQNCTQVGVYPLGTSGAGEYENRLNDAGYLLQPVDLLSTSDSIWALTPSVCSDGAPTTASVCRADVSCGAGFICIQNPQNIVEIDPATGAVRNRYAAGFPHVARALSDGVYLWVVSDPTITGQIQISKVRMSDGLIMPGYPMDLPDQPRALTFDGTYVWIVGESRALRINAATDTMTIQVSGLQTNSAANASLFDGQYLWVLAGCTDAGVCADGSNRPLRLSKVRVNQGRTQPDYGTVVQLKANPGTCSVTTSQQCLYDWHCPGTEVCSTGNTVQIGHTHLSGSVEVRHGYCQAGGQTYYNRPCTSDATCSDLPGGSCRGGNVMVGDDVSSPENQWAGSDETVTVTGGSAQCATDGTFVKGVVIGDTSQIESIICRGL